MNKEQAKALFEKYDHDHSKGITMDEFGQMIYDFFDIRSDSDALDEMINDLFTLADGKGLLNRKDDRLNFSEFYHIAQYLPKEFKNVRRTVGYVIFKLVDNDNSGDISKKELVEYLKKVGGEEFQSNEILDIFKDADKNSNGKLEYEEFMNLYNFN